METKNNQFIHLIKNTFATWKMSFPSLVGINLFLLFSSAFIPTESLTHLHLSQLDIYQFFYSQAPYFLTIFTASSAVACLSYQLVLDRINDKKICFSSLFQSFRKNFFKVWGVFFLYLLIAGISGLIASPLIGAVVYLLKNGATWLQMTPVFVVTGLILAVPFYLLLSLMLTLPVLIHEQTGVYQSVKRSSHLVSSNRVKIFAYTLLSTLSYLTMDTAFSYLLPASLKGLSPTEFLSGTLTPVFWTCVYLQQVKRNKEIAS